MYPLFSVVVVGFALVSDSMLISCSWGLTCTDKIRQYRGQDESLLGTCTEKVGIVD